MAEKRIELLDSFRCIAIVSVLLYHFTDRWTKYFPFDDYYQHAFRYGYLGVHFFFMISGFVICYTLERTGNGSLFARNRFARLFPAMLLCSLITIFLCRWLDSDSLFPYAHKFQNLLPSLSFISPEIWNKLSPEGLF